MLEVVINKMISLRLLYVSVALNDHTSRLLTASRFPYRKGVLVLQEKKWVSLVIPTFSTSVLAYLLLESEMCDLVAY